MRTIQTCLGRMQEVIAELPEQDRQRAAYRSYGFLGSEIVIKLWPNRPAMLKTCEMQEQRMSKQSDWSPVVKPKALWDNR